MEEQKERSLQVGTDCGFILVAEPLVHVLVHERGLPDTIKGHGNHER